MADPLAAITLPNIPLRLTTKEAKTVDGLIERDAQGDDAAWEELTGPKLQNTILYFVQNYQPRTEQFLGMMEDLLSALPTHKRSGSGTEKFLADLAYSCAYARRPVLFRLVMEELAKRTKDLRKTSWRRERVLEAMNAGVDAIFNVFIPEPEDYLSYTPTEGEVKYIVSDEPEILYDEPPPVPDRLNVGGIDAVYITTVVDRNATAIVAFDYKIKATTKTQRAALDVSKERARLLSKSVTTAFGAGTARSRLPEDLRRPGAYKSTTSTALAGLAQNDAGRVQAAAPTRTLVARKVAKAKATKETVDRNDNDAVWVGYDFEELDSEDSDEGENLMARFKDQAREERQTSPEAEFPGLQEALAAAMGQYLEEEDEPEFPIENFAVAKSREPAVLTAIQAFFQTGRLDVDYSLLVDVMVYAVSTGGKKLEVVFFEGLASLKSTPGVQDFVARLAYSAAYARRHILFSMCIKYISDTTQFDDDAVFTRETALNYLAAGIADLVKAVQETAGKTPYTLNPGEVMWDDQGKPLARPDIIDARATYILRADYNVEGVPNLVQEALLGVPSARCRELGVGIQTALDRLPGGAGLTSAVAGNLFRLAAIVDEGGLGLVIDLPIGTSAEELPIEAESDDDVPLSVIAERIRRTSPPQREITVSPQIGAALVQQAAEDEKTLSLEESVQALGSIITSGREGPAGELIVSIASWPVEEERETAVSRLVDMGRVAAYFRRAEIHGAILAQLQLRPASTAAEYSAFGTIVAAITGVVDFALGQITASVWSPVPGEVVNGVISGEAVDANLSAIITQRLRYNNFSVEEQEEMNTIPFLALDAQIRKLKAIMNKLDGTTDSSESVAILGAIRKDSIMRALTRIAPSEDLILGVLIEGSPIKTSAAIPLTLEEGRREEMDAFVTRQLGDVGVTDPFSSTFTADNSARDAAIAILQRGQLGISAEYATTPEGAAFRAYVNSVSDVDLVAIANSAAFARRATLFWVAAGVLSQRNVPFSIGAALRYAVDGVFLSLTDPAHQSVQALEQYRANPSEVAEGETDVVLDIGVVDMYLAATLAPLARVATYDMGNRRLASFVSENEIASLMSKYASIFTSFSGKGPDISLAHNVLASMYTVASAEQAEYLRREQILPPPAAIFGVSPERIPVGPSNNSVLRLSFDSDASTVGDVDATVRSMSLGSGVSVASNSMPSDDSDVTVGILDESLVKEMAETGTNVTRGVVAGALEDFATRVIEEASIRASSSTPPRPPSLPPTTPVRRRESASLLTAVASDAAGGGMDQVNSVLTRLGLAPESPEIDIESLVSPIRPSGENGVYAGHPGDGTRTPSLPQAVDPTPNKTYVLAGSFDSPLAIPSPSPSGTRSLSRNTWVNTVLAPTKPPPGTNAAFAERTVARALEDERVRSSIAQTTLDEVSATLSDYSSSLSRSSSGTWSPATQAFNSFPTEQSPGWTPSISMTQSSPVPRLDLSAAQRLSPDSLTQRTAGGPSSISSDDDDAAAPSSGRGGGTFRQPLFVGGMEAPEIDDFLKKQGFDVNDPQTLINAMVAIADAKIVRGSELATRVEKDRTAFKTLLRRYLTLVGQEEEAFSLDVVKESCASNLRPYLLAVLSQAKISFNSYRGQLLALCRKVLDSAVDKTMTFAEDDSSLGKALVHSLIASTDERTMMSLRMLFHDHGRRSTQFMGVGISLLRVLGKLASRAPIVLTHAYIAMVASLNEGETVAVDPCPSAASLSLTQHRLRHRAHGLDFARAIRTEDLDGIESHWLAAISLRHTPLSSSLSANPHGFYIANSPLTLAAIMENDSDAVVDLLFELLAGFATKQTLILLAPTDDDELQASSSTGADANPSRKQEKAKLTAAFTRALQDLYLINVGLIDLEDYLLTADRTTITYLLTLRHPGRFAPPDAPFVIQTVREDGTPVYSNSVNRVEPQTYTTAVLTILRRDTVVNNAKAILSPWTTGLFDEFPPSVSSWFLLGSILEHIAITPRQRTFVIWFSALAESSVLAQFGSGAIVDEDLVEEMIEAPKVMDEGSSSGAERPRASTRLDVAIMLRSRLVERIAALDPKIETRKALSDKVAAQRIKLVGRYLSVPAPKYLVDVYFGLATRNSLIVELLITQSRGLALRAFLTLFAKPGPFMVSHDTIDHQITRTAIAGNLIATRALLVAFGDQITGLATSSALAIGALADDLVSLKYPTGLETLPTDGETTERERIKITYLIMRYIAPPVLARDILNSDYERVSGTLSILGLFDIYDERVMVALRTVAGPGYKKDKRMGVLVMNLSAAQEEIKKKPGLARLLAGLNMSRSGSTTPTSP
jgi:hypothetical protein